MKIATFKNAEDAFPVVAEVEWPDIVKGLSWFREISGEDKTKCPAWSPAEYNHGDRRGIKNVGNVCCAVLDYDHGVTFHEGLERWSGYERLAHTTWSHSTAEHRFRVVLPLQRPVPAHLWSAGYRWLVGTVDGGRADSACSDPSRIFFMPATGKGGPHVSRRFGGTWLDLLDHAEAEYIRAQQEAEALRDRRRASLSERPGDVPAWRTESEARIRLDIDPDARMKVAGILGATIVKRAAGTIAIGMICPNCGDESAWLIVDARHANLVQCNHRKTCGWSSPLIDYVLGVEVEE